MNNLSISQNFLVNTNFVKELVNKTSINKKDLVIEIGPGKGIITEVLLEKANNVIAIELDPKLSFKLQGRFKDKENVKIVNNDFLKYTLPSVSYKIFSNPPFNISADILNKLLKIPNNMTEAYLILQDKTVERFSEIGNQISILWKPFYEISVVQRINKKEFKPTPNVDIVLAKFKKLENPLVRMDNYQLYRDFVIYGYNQWKPTILESFSKVFTKEQLKIINKKYNLESLKPSDLSISRWIVLFDTFLSYVDDTKRVLVKGYEITQLTKHKSMIKRNRTNI